MKEKYFYLAVFLCLLVMTISAVVDSYYFSNYLKYHSQFVEVGEITYNPDLK
jgi:hypothetical protein